MKQRDKYQALYDSLVEMENSKSLFTVSDLAISTLYKKGTLAVYIRNKLKNKYLFTEDGIVYSVSGIKDMPFRDFQKIMSQKGPSENLNEIETRLQIKSFESFALAIEVYNKPLVTYRIEAFLILIINSWELLLKAIIVRTKGESAIFRQDENKSLSISESLEVLIPKKNDPTRKNLELLIEMRDQAVHLVIPAIQGSLSRIFQASVINYLKFSEKYEIQPSIDFKGLGLLSFVTDIKDYDYSAIKLDYGELTADAVKNFLTSFQENEKQISSSEYAIPINYHYVLTDKDTDGDIKIQISKDGPIARIVEIPKVPERTHPYRAKDLLDKVNATLKAQNKSVTKNDLYSIIFCEKIKNDKSNKYYYRMDNPITHRYSQEFCDMIVKKIIENNAYLEGCCRKYKQRKPKK